MTIETRCMKKTLTIILFTFVIQGQGQELFDGFKILKIPRENIPLGAEWLNGLGENGLGTSEDNITISKTIKLYEMDNSFKQSLNLSILSYFNLGADFLSNTAIDYTNLTIYKVKDFSNLNLRNGQCVIYECIKADSIFFKVNKDINGELKLKLDEKLKDLKLTSFSNFKKGLTFSGEKLFLAYRVLELGETKVTEKSKAIKGPGMTDQRIIKIKLYDYNLSFNDNDFINCMYPEYPKVNISNHDNFNECSKKYLISVEVINFKSQNINGVPLSKRFNIMNSSKTSIAISDRINSNIVTDYFQIYFSLETSFKVGHLKLNEDYSKVTITRMSTPIKMLKEPQAPGW